MNKRNYRLGQILWLGSSVILIGIPFHALLTAWFASNFGYFDLIRLWKELILLMLALVASFILLSDRDLLKRILKNKIFMASGVFVLFIAFMTIVGLIFGKVSMAAAGYGFIIDSRFFVFMMIIMVASHTTPLPRQWQKWFIYPAIIVTGFGLLQLTVLPHDFLRHFGYGVHTLPAYQPVDNKPALARLQSTLRGPNPLGAYLLPLYAVILAGAAFGRRHRKLLVAICMAIVIVVLGSYSRSAAIGLLITTWVFVLLSLKTRAQKQLLVGLSVALVVFGGIAIYGLRHNSSVENIVFHTNERSTSATSSNAARTSALKSGLTDVLHNPLGGGIGVAGPASLRNTKQPARIAENFFIQIAQEAGVLGLVLFSVALFALGNQLWVQRSDTMVRAVLASLVGLIFVNIVSHAWADDTLAYVFFGLVIIAIVKIGTKSENLRYTKA
jgi:hypothetical protein